VDNQFFKIEKGKQFGLYSGKQKSATSLTVVRKE